MMKYKQTTFIKVKITYLKSAELEIVSILVDSIESYIYLFLLSLKCHGTTVFSLQ